uniref:beta-N-acetylhexosaminidase n=1 Tax=Oryza glumipatula TaxID=40148 RepID=A0A0D9ZYP9_9ORYZ
MGLNNALAVQARGGIHFIEHLQGVLRWPPVPQPSRNPLTGGGMVTLFPDPYLHGGTDEVNTACWENDPVVRRFLTEGGTHNHLLEVFINTTRPFVAQELNQLPWHSVPQPLGQPVCRPPSHRIESAAATVASSFRRIAAATIAELPMNGSCNHRRTPTDSALTSHRDHRPPSLMNRHHNHRQAPVADESPPQPSSSSRR